MNKFFNSIILSFLLLLVPMPPLSAQPRDKKTRGGLPAISKTKLEVRAYSGGDLDSSIPWERSLTVTSQAKLYFRWHTSEEDVTSAEWQVTDSPGGFSAQPNIIADGQRTEPPVAGQMYQFGIDLKQFLSQQQPNSPKNYYVRIVPKKGQQKLAPSLSVKITYMKPGPGPVIYDFNIDRFEQNLKSRLDGKATGYAYAI